MDLALIDGEVDPFQDLDVTGAGVKSLDLKEGSGLAHTHNGICTTPIGEMLSFSRTDVGL